MKLVVTLFSIFAPLLWSASAFSQESTEKFGMESPNYGWLLTKTAFILVGLCFMAYVGLRYLSKMNLGARGPMQILGRLPIEGRRSVVVVDIAGKTLIIGSSEAGMHTLGELDAEQKKAFHDAEKHPTSFKERLTRSQEIHANPTEPLMEEEV